MGCDIHTYIEFKNNDGDWTDGNFYEKERYGEGGFLIVYPYRNRNYALFSILAGVRNYGNNVPISVPKGLPDDVCDTMKGEYAIHECDAHSCSYLTLGEIHRHLEKYPKVKYRGMISPKQQRELDKGILPQSWCQGTNQDGYEFREWEEDDNILQPIIDVLKDRMEHFMWCWTDKQIKEREDDIRLVFWFDN